MRNQNFKNKWKPMINADFIIPSKGYYLVVYIIGYDTPEETKKMNERLNKFLHSLNYNYYENESKTNHKLIYKTTLEEIEKVKNYSILTCMSGNYGYLSLSTRIYNTIPKE